MLFVAYCSRDTYSSCVESLFQNRFDVASESSPVRCAQSLSGLVLVLG